MRAKLALHLLRAPCVDLDGEAVRISRRKAVELLAYLAVERECHGREMLVTLLSPEFEPSRARAQLRRTLSVLNGIVGGRSADGRSRDRRPKSRGSALAGRGGVSSAVDGE